MYFTSILAVTDLSIDGDRAVQRAAQLARSHGATLKLLYAPISADPLCADPTSRLAQCARAITGRTGQKVQALQATATMLEHVARHAQGADLLVVAHRRERTLCAFLAGQLGIRLTRLCRCPVLLTQREPRLHFKRILAAVDFALPATRLAEIAYAIDKHALVELFHPLDTVGAPRLLSAIHRDDPARQAVRRQETLGADLLVVGKQRRTAWADLLLGSTARRVLARATCDVLIVPHGHPPSTRAAAMRRMTTGPGVPNNALGRASARFDAQG